MMSSSPEMTDSGNSANPGGGKLFFHIRSSPAVLSLILFAGTVILYIPALSANFLNYDDDGYVTANTHVLRGPSWGNIVWAFTTTEEANWHPLTWISHMLDAQVFGIHPFGHHLVSVLLHALNVVLLFLVLRRATSNLARSALVAALFAVHPLNVECVAWVAERKSLLSMFFFLLALLAYERYSRHRNAVRYAVVALLFALGLMAKPMVVTLPILLLLWDYWPLSSMGTKVEVPQRPSLAFLIGEKIPLLVLSAASSVITLYAQRRGGAMVLAQLLPLRQRVANGLYSYFKYLVKGLWPSHLAVFYPHPENSLALWKVAAAALLLGAITLLVWLYRERGRYLLTGWLWYLIAMLPMIGIVQVGRQAMADRYAYLPFMGLFILAVWGCADLFAQLALAPPVQVVLAAVPLLAYASTTFVQIAYWHDSYRLFAHAVQVTEHNAIAEENLGSTLVEMGKSELAVPHFQAAVTFMPQFSAAHYNLAILAQQQGYPDDAVREYELALQYASDPSQAARAHNNLGFLWLNRGNLKPAIDQFSAALQLYPDKQNSLFGRGMAEYRLGNLDAAVTDFSRAATVAPMAPADFWRGRALEDKGQIEAAIHAYQAALQLNSGLTEARDRLTALQAHH
jgi:protein O-mannosyl-transferase